MCVNKFDKIKIQKQQIYTLLATTHPLPKNNWFLVTPTRCSDSLRANQRGVRVCRFEGRRRKWLTLLLPPPLESPINCSCRVRAKTRWLGSRNTNFHTKTTVTVRYNTYTRTTGISAGIIWV